MNYEEFFEIACQPAFGDQMAFQMKAADPDPKTTFSIQGFENIGTQMINFILARTCARMQGQGLPAKELHAMLKLSWNSFDHELLDVGPPWYSLLDKDGGLRTIDSNVRVNLHRG